MKRVGSALVVGIVLLSLSAGSALCNRSGPDSGAGDFDIYVSPSVIVKSAPCPWITIHTSVPFSAVDTCSVTVNGTSVLIDHTYADSLGNLVVKLRFDDVAGLVSAPSATFTLVLDEESRATDTVVSVKQ